MALKGTKTIFHKKWNLSALFFVTPSELIAEPLVTRSVATGYTAWVAVAKRLKNVNYREAVIETIVEQWSCEA